MDNKKIVDSMTNEQLAKFARGKGFWHLQNDDAFNFKTFKMSDGPHGLRTEKDNYSDIKDKVYKSVCFPSMSLAACSFDKTLINEFGSVLAEEAKHLGVHVILGPAVNVKRDPKCGRNFEYISEDPFVIGELATAYINGVQNKGIGTSIKHFACNNSETDRMSINTVVDERALREIYLRGFEVAIKKSQPWTVMASYNRVNGPYATESCHLLTEILRDEWGFQGFVESDWTAVNDINAAILAGMDLEMPEAGGAFYQDSLNGINSDENIKNAYKKAVERQLNIRDKALVLNPDFKFDYKKDHDFARKIACESIVLLKNEENILPLSKDEKILFVGALADKPRYQGGGSSNINPFKVTKMSEIIKENSNIEIIDGYKLDKDEINEHLINEIKEKAPKFDKIVCFMGFNLDQESEGFDKKDIKFYQNQLHVIDVLKELNKNIIVVLENGSVIEIPFASDVKAIIETYLGGEAINESIYDILFGNVNPSGKLNETFAHKYEDYPSSSNFPGDHYNIMYKESIFVGYRYFDTFKKDVLFPFGYGLSYTKFDFSDLELVQNDDHVIVSFKVTNIGDREGKEVAQVYIKNAAEPQYFIENKGLKGFEKINLKPGESKKISIKIDFNTLKIFNIETNKFELLNGKYIVYVGNSSIDERLQSEFHISNGTTNKYYYENIENLLNGNIDKITDDEFKELFIDKKLPLHLRSSVGYDINTTLQRAIDEGSKGAKKFINFVSMIPMLKKDPMLLTFLRTSTIRQIYLGTNGKLSKKDVQTLIDLINDVHININFIKVLWSLRKLAGQKF